MLCQVCHWRLSLIILSTTISKHQSSWPISANLLGKLLMYRNNDKKNNKTIAASGSPVLSVRMHKAQVGM